MNGFIIVAILIALLVTGVLVALWLAPEGEETENGFQITGPSAFQRLRGRIARRLKRRSHVGDPRLP